MQESVRDGARPADPPERPILFVNPKSGDGTAMRVRLADRASERGIEVAVLGPDQELAALVDEAVAGGAKTLGMAGGDGSLGVVAAAAHTHDLPFVCVPAGTRNHFALDLGIDANDPVSALDAFTEGVERRIDMGRVNGRLFINNVSLGVYAEAVRQSAYRDAKVRTLLETTREVLGPSAAAPELRVLDDAGREHLGPSIVLVSNNPYALDRPSLHGARPTLDGGLLGIVVLDEPGSSGAPWRAWSATSLEVHAPGPVHAGIDGEAVDLSPPLEFEVVPAALRVRISARESRPRLLRGEAARAAVGKTELLVDAGDGANRDRHLPAPSRPLMPVRGADGAGAPNLDLVLGHTVIHRDELDVRGRCRANEETVRLAPSHGALITAGKPAFPTVAGRAIRAEPTTPMLHGGRPLYLRSLSFETRFPGVAPAAHLPAS